MFNNKIPPPIVAILFAFAMWYLADLTPSLPLNDTLRLALTLTLLLCGVGFLLAGGVSFRRAKTTVNPLKPDAATALVTSGIFQYTRNPMYLGFVCLLVSLAIFMASLWALTGVAGFVLYIKRFQIRPEEAAMHQLFGEQFTAYRARVRRWI